MLAMKIQRHYRHDHVYNLFVQTNILQRDKYCNVAYAQPYSMSVYFEYKLSRT